MIRFVSYFFVCVLAVPAGLFVIGSMTGTHSITYNREGTWLCHTPYRSNSVNCERLVSWVPVSKLNDVAPSARGYIRCRDGHLEIGNIDFSQENMHIPDGQFAIYARSEWCEE